MSGTAPRVATTLGGASSDDVDAFSAAQKQREEALSRAKLIAIDGWLAGYQAGSVSFESMCRGVVAATRVLPDDMGLVGLIGGRERLIGHAVRIALESPPKKAGRANGWPRLFKEMAARLVDAVHKREGLVRKPTRHEPRTGSAYARVVELFSAAGVQGITERNIEDWRNEYRKIPDFRDD